MDSNEKINQEKTLENYDVPVITTIENNDNLTFVGGGENRDR